MNIANILKKAVDGERLSLEEGVALLEGGEMLALGQAANLVRFKRHPEKLVTFVIDRNINYTNVCITKCRFCAFYRNLGDKDAYVLTNEKIFEKIQETIDHGGTQILMQGGLHPELDITYYEQLLCAIKERYKIHVHSFSPPEIWHIANQSKLTIEEVISRLKVAGLDSIPGGGAEILDNRVRHYISPLKITWEQWMQVMETAHYLNLKTTATMMFGSVETVEERIKHMIRVRDLQDKTHGFTAFIPWSFQPVNTELGGDLSTGVEYLKTLSVARLMLDNVPNIQASWVTQGAKMAQVALAFGANDFGGTMLEENVVRAAGVINRVPLQEIVECIKDAGFRAAQRSTLYQIIKDYH